MHDTATEASAITPWRSGGRGHTPLQPTEAAAITRVVVAVVVVAVAVAVAVVVVVVVVVFSFFIFIYAGLHSVFFFCSSAPPARNPVELPGPGAVL